MYYKQKNNISGGISTMSEEKRVMRDEEAKKLSLEKLLKKSDSSRNNKAFICGTIQEELRYDHNVKWENFYRTEIKVKRLSGNVDLIPIIVSEIWVKNILKENLVGKFVTIVGQFRSYNKHDEDNKSHLELFLFATEFKLNDENNAEEEICDTNMIFLDGYLCKAPVLRKTPKGRFITDCLIATNRLYGKSDYIPGIAWGRTAKWLSNFKEGDRFQLYGRIQSREYSKIVDKDEPKEQGEVTRVIKIAYEISIKRIQNKREEQPEIETI